MERDENLILTLQVVWQENRLSRETVEQIQEQHELFWRLANGPNADRSSYWQSKLVLFETKCRCQFKEEYNRVEKNPWAYRKTGRKPKTRIEITGT